MSHAAKSPGFGAALRRLAARLAARPGRAPDIPAPLWAATLGAYPFLAALDSRKQARLRDLCALFLHRKRFYGAHGMRVEDGMALEVAAQACLPLLGWGPPGRALAWYDDFVGIVLYPGPVLARRERRDSAGVVHRYRETLLGEAMQDGPVVLDCSAVQAGRRAPIDAHQTGNVVIHEFAHKIDMRNGQANGCPPLPPGFLGSRAPHQARRLWQEAWSQAFGDFCERVARAERFGGAPPWLDGYAASDPGEFFAVACEGFFVERARFAQEFPQLDAQLAALFYPTP